MAKQLSSNEITQKDLEAYIESQDDFRFELSVYQKCKSIGHKCSHGGTYTDPITNKTRQYDIRMEINLGPYYIYLAIECKFLKSNFPLLISRVPREQDEAFHEVIFSTKNDPEYFLGTSIARPSLFSHEAKAIRISSDEALFPVNEFVGKSINQVGRATNNGELIVDNSEVYDKWTQALSQANDLVSAASYDFEKNQTGLAFSIVLPILIVPDDTIWAIDYEFESVNKIGPNRVDSCDFFFGKEYLPSSLNSASYTFSHLSILTESKLSTLLQEIVVTGKFLNKAFPEKALKGKSH